MTGNTKVWALAIPPEFNHLHIYIFFNLFFFFSCPKAQRLLESVRIWWGSGAELPSLAVLLVYSLALHRAQDEQNCLSTMKLQSCTPKSCALLSLMCSVCSTIPLPSWKTIKVQGAEETLSSNWEKCFSCQSSHIFSQSNKHPKKTSLDAVEDDSVMPLSM